MSHPISRAAGRAAASAAGFGLALALGACGADAPADPGSTGSALDTVTAGKLTIATGEPAYEPWVMGDDPASGEGFEAAVSYALANKLGFAAADVVWTRTTFDSAIAPGPKDWDLNIQQFSATPERAQAVDFSSPYYTTSQAVLSCEGSPAVGAASLADLADISFGVQVGTTSLSAVETIIKPTTEAKVFNDSADVVKALSNHQVQAIVTDLPQALYLAAAEVDGGVVVGQLDSTAGGDDFAYVLPKGSALTAPVSAALDELQADGTLDALTTQWLSTSIDVPVLT
jgi:polar amino acid transport system substrate-binding protein